MLARTPKTHAGLAYANLRGLVNRNAGVVRGRIQGDMPGFGNRVSGGILERDGPVVAGDTTRPVFI